MRIITNADDFGQDEDTVRATIECLDNGSLTSATIMVKMPATAAAVAYARANPDKSFGVHLTYVLGVGNEAPVADPAKLPALTSPDGLFKPSQGVRLQALRGAIPVDQIEIETEAQLALLRDMGVNVSHVDSHGHLHRFGPFREALRRVLPRFGIKKVRNVQDVYIRKPLKSPNYWFGPLWRRRLMHSFQTTDRFYMPTSAGDHGWWDPLLARRMEGTLEVGVHPGYTEPWREEERTSIRRFAEAARTSGHTLIGWREL